ncbi:MAG: hypothetical protein QOJ29_4068 [Thermoleophilaceae bacterium]|jgi:hypothetical protein|nr:hypothetical protein [Thermoleophilaceae bacterium]
MKRIDLVKKNDRWVGQSEGKTVRGTAAPRKGRERQEDRAVARTADEAVSVRIHTQDGRPQKEWTYPRSADPRGSMG